MKKVIGSNKLLELSKILKIEQTEVKDYFSDLNDDKFIKIFKQIKRNKTLEETIDYLSFILDITNFKILDELSTRLMRNIELMEYVDYKRDSDNNNKFVKTLINYLDEDQMDTKIAYSDNGKVIYVWTKEEEQTVFRNYNSAREELKEYIINNNYNDVIEYSKSIAKRCNPAKYKDKEPEFKLEYIIEYLYSETFNEECIISLRKDKNALRLINICKEIRDDISIHNYGLVKSIALNDKYQNRGLSSDDLIQEGSIGLLAAIERFDVTRGIKFSTYATNGIKLSVDRAIANEGNTIRIPVHLHEKRVKVNRIIKMLRDSDGIEEPSIEDIFEKCNEEGINISLDQIKTVMDFESIGNPLSYDLNYNDDDYSLKDFLYDDSVDANSYAEATNDKEIREQYLKNIGKGLTRFGTTIRRNSKGNIVFKLISLYDDTGPIKILLKKEEYNYYILGIRKYGKERMLEFLTKYGINPSTVSSKYKIEDYVLTRDEFEVLVYRFRRGFLNEETDRLLRYRNRNNALYDDESGYHTKKEITHVKLGKLFGVTRDVIRRAEERVAKKMGDTTIEIVELQLDHNSVNLCSTFNINKDNYCLSVPDNDVIKVDEEYNIYPANKGKVEVFMLNIKTGNIKKAIIEVKELKKISKKNILKMN